LKKHSTFIFKVQQVLDSVLIPLPDDAVSYGRRTELSPTLLRKPLKSSLEDDGKDGKSKGS